MPGLTFMLLHVQDHAASAAFYSELPGLPIVEQKDGFAALPLRDGVVLGLWSRDGVEPASTGQSGGGEMAFAVGDAAAVEATHDDWERRGVLILQPPTPMSFGVTFVAGDPDGHRLRVFAPPGA